jgi:hypothetical protein
VTCLAAGEQALTRRVAEFTKCLEKADMPSCTWYLEQLKAVSA